MRLQILLLSALVPGCSAGTLGSRVVQVEPSIGIPAGHGQLASTATAQSNRPNVLAEPRGIYVTSSNPERPRVRFHDGQLSRNDTCFVRLGNKLNHKVPPLYINGAPVGFC